MMVARYNGFTLNVRALSAVDPYFRFRMRIELNKCHWTFTKLDVYIDTVEIWFGIANGQTSIF